MQTRHAVLSSYGRESVSLDSDGMYSNLCAHTIAMVISQSSRPVVRISMCLSSEPLLLPYQRLSKFESEPTRAAKSPTKPVHRESQRLRESVLYDLRYLSPASMVRLDHHPPVGA